jgi:hypothetical protein
LERGAGAARAHPGGRQFEATKMPQSYSLDLSPNPDGDVLGVALKHDGDTEAYAFSAQSYLVAGLRHPRTSYPMRLTKSRWRLAPAR